jgi:hypothetical protein
MFDPGLDPGHEEAPRTMLVMVFASPGPALVA